MAAAAGSAHLVSPFTSVRTFVCFSVCAPWVIRDCGETSRGAGGWSCKRCRTPLQSKLGDCTAFHSKVNCDHGIWYGPDSAAYRSRRDLQRRPCVPIKDRDESPPLRYTARQVLLYIIWKKFPTHVVLCCCAKVRSQIFSEWAPSIVGSVWLLHVPC